MRKLTEGQGRTKKKKVYSWLYALAQSDKDLVYEYVQSTEGEYISSKAAMKLYEFVKCPVKVQRCAGRVLQTELLVQVDQRDIVPGDIVIFEPGTCFLEIQSSLTGESWTTEKMADTKENQSTPLLELKNICFMGTNVVSGSGTGLVISTGSKTYMSTMFSTIGKQKPPDGFENGIRHISYVLIGVMLIVMTIIIMAYYLKSHDLSESILFGLSVACALTPNMLPLIVNTSLAKGAVAMAQDRCIVKSLAAIRDMGSMDILCMDKTGTLTMNRAIVVNHLDSWGSPNEEVLRFAFLNSYFKTDQKYPLDDAILAFVYTNGYRFKPSKYRKIDEIPFDFIRRRVSVILKLDTMQKAEISKLLRGSWGTMTTFSSEDYRRILNMGEEFSNQGLRIIGVAMKRLEMERSDPSNIVDEFIESDMVFLGVITFFDPPKDSAKQALWRLAEKGVKAKVLTGDSLSLAKLRVVQSLQTVGDHVVGFLGDGINDSLAIDAANVGISVDSGASVSKDYADIILLEKDLNVLVDGVEHGRLTFGNTMKYIKMSVVANVGGVLSLLIATLMLGFEPVTPRQLLTQTFLYSVGQIAIPWDKLEDDYVKIPQKWSEKGLPMFILWNGPLCTICDIANLLFLCFYYANNNGSYDKFFHSAWFIEGLLMQTLIFHLIRTEKIPFIQEIASWPVLCSTVVISAMGIAIPFTVVGEVMGFTDLPISYFGFLVLLFLGYFSIGQVVKRVYILIYRKWL
ncbi:hypothetical protein GH714_034341 [Hevea brasiliensis]|uniref:Uncharacterized protein n=1 Tax=Hevea brasiliensis TaxID=3981 RepID=A0A6A6KWE4_HEVBR|nr:hypothetical protein GH714_034341 [Hevea brasiliensis]